MARPNKHKDVEFHVEAESHSKFNHSTPVVCKTMAEASAAAVEQSVMKGVNVNIDVVVYSTSGARWYGGDDAVALYKDDPDTSVFERIVVQAHALGRVP